jgi:hypothetical protein
MRLRQRIAATLMALRGRRLQHDPKQESMMTKTAVQSAKTKAAFQWDPNNDQTYSLDQDLILPGPASNFSKAIGKSFTMD